MALDSPAQMTRRTAIKRVGALAGALGAIEAVGPFSFAPQRVGASLAPSDIQFDISPFLTVPPQDYGSDVQFQMPPVHTVFLTTALERTPVPADRAEMERVQYMFHAPPPPRLPPDRADLTGQIS